MTTVKTRKPATKPATAATAPSTPPAWPTLAAVGSFAGTYVHSKSAFTTFAALGIDLPPAVTTAVSNLSRAARVVPDVGPVLEQARNDYARELAAYIAGDRTAPPSLDTLSYAHGLVQAASEDGHRLARSAAEQAQTDAARAVTANADTIIENARPAWEQQVTTLERCATLLPVNLLSMSDVGTNREHIMAMADAQDAATMLGRLTEARGQLALAQRVPRPVVDDGFILARYPAAVKLPDGVGQVGRWLLLVRQRETCGLWWPTTADLATVDVNRPGRPKAMEADGKGRLREPSHSSGEIL